MKIDGAKAIRIEFVSALLEPSLSRTGAWIQLPKRKLEKDKYARPLNGTFINLVQSEHWSFNAAETEASAKRTNWPPK